MDGAHRGSRKAFVWIKAADCIRHSVTPTFFVPITQRDLKPQNLILSKAGPEAELKIADFGFARILQPQVGGEN